MNLTGIELADCERTLLREIAMKESHQRDIALTYALAMRSSECDRIDWRKVNLAIIKRWSRAGLERVKAMAHKIERVREMAE